MFSGRSVSLAAIFLVVSLTFSWSQRLSAHTVLEKDLYAPAKDTSVLFGVKHRPVDVILRTRVMGEVQNQDWKIKCNYLCLTVKGEFLDDFLYVIRQRFDKPISEGDFLSGTDYLWLGWRKNGWEVGAGKRNIACGSWEYNTLACDEYFRPEFFKNLGKMYKYVVNASYHTGGEHFLLQFGNSIYSQSVSNLLGYSFQVRGLQGVWQHVYSVNFFEREKGMYNQFLCLGNKFITGPVIFHFDIDHRIDLNKPTFMKDFSLAGEVKVSTVRWLDVFAKATYDRNDCVEDPMLPVSTDVWKAGGGLEFYPSKKYRGIRLFCTYYNINGDVNVAQAGFVWTLNFVDLIEMYKNK